MIYLKDSKKQMKGTQDSVKVFQDILALEDRIEREKEHFYVMMLDIRSRIKMVEVVFVGTLTSSLVHHDYVSAGLLRRLEGRGEEEGEVGCVSWFPVGRAPA